MADTIKSLREQLKIQLHARSVQDDVIAAMHATVAQYRERDGQLTSENEQLQNKVAALQSEIRRDKTRRARSKRSILEEIEKRLETLENRVDAVVFDD